MARRLLWTRITRTDKPAGRSPIRLSEGAVMRSMLALVGLVVLLFLGLGWYLDWYAFRPAPVLTDPSRKTYTIDINTKKITDDVGKKIHDGEERLHDFFDNETNRAGVPAD